MNFGTRTTELPHCPLRGNGIMAELVAHVSSSTRTRNRRSRFNSADRDSFRSLLARHSAESPRRQLQVILAQVDTVNHELMYRLLVEFMPKMSQTAERVELLTSILNHPRCQKAADARELRLSMWEALQWEEIEADRVNYPELRARPTHDDDEALLRYLAHRQPSGVQGKPSAAAMSLLSRRTHNAIQRRFSKVYAPLHAAGLAIQVSMLEKVVAGRVALPLDPRAIAVKASPVTFDVKSYGERFDVVYPDGWVESKRLNVELEEPDILLPVLVGDYGILWSTALLKAERVILPLFRDALRPLFKTWADEHPQLVRWNEFDLEAEVGAEATDALLLMAGLAAGTTYRVQTDAHGNPMLPWDAVERANDRGLYHSTFTRAGPRFLTVVGSGPPFQVSNDDGELSEAFRLIRQSTRAFRADRPAATLQPNRYLDQVGSYLGKDCPVAGMELLQRLMVLYIATAKRIHEDHLKDIYGQA